MSRREGERSSSCAALGRDNEASRMSLKSHQSPRRAPVAYRRSGGGGRRLEDGAEPALLIIAWHHLIVAGASMKMNRPETFSLTAGGMAIAPCSCVVAPTRAPASAGEHFSSGSNRTRAKKQLPMAAPEIISRRRRVSMPLRRVETMAATAAYYQMRSKSAQHLISRMLVRNCHQVLMAFRAAS